MKREKKKEREKERKRFFEIVKGELEFFCFVCISLAAEEIKIGRKLKPKLIMINYYSDSTKRCQCRRIFKFNNKSVDK